MIGQSGHNDSKRSGRHFSSPQLSFPHVCSPSFLLGCSACVSASDHAQAAPASSLNSATLLSMPSSSLPEPGAGRRQSQLHSPSLQRISGGGTLGVMPLPTNTSESPSNACNPPGDQGHPRVIRAADTDSHHHPLRLRPRGRRLKAARRQAQSPGPCCQSQTQGLSLEV
eukprot:1839909-Rhodomonas_salina.3